MRENVYVNKVSDNKYEFITKDINLEPGTYTLHSLDKNLFVMKKQFYKTNYSYEKPNTETSQNQQEETKTEQYKSNDTKEPTEQQDKSSTQEWYKKALELKTRLVQEQFLSLQDVEEVRKISYVTRQDINSGEILGIRSFDKNYYVFKKVLFDKIKTALLALFNKDPIALEDILEKLQYPKEQVLGVIELLKEQSDLIEVRKGIFKKV